MNKLVHLSTVLFALLVLWFNYSYVLNIIKSLEVDKYEMENEENMLHSLDPQQTDYFTLLFAKMPVVFLLAIVCRSNKILKLSTF